MSNPIRANAEKKNTTTFSPVFGKKSSARTIASNPAREGLDAAHSTFGHNFADIRVESPSFKQSCPLSLPGPAHCPFGGACHACPPRAQAKLKIGQPGDKYEREADRVADEVMRMPEPRIQRKTCPSCNENDEEKQFQAKPVVGRISPLVQKQADGEKEDEEDGVLQPRKAPGRTPGVPRDARTIMNNLESAGKPLSRSERLFFEPRFGCDLSHVRLHSGPGAGRAAGGVNARAFTIGRDVVFGTSQYSPGTGEGRRLLAHELTHVIQQGGMAPSMAPLQKKPGFTAKDVAEFKSEPPKKKPPCACLVFVHNNEKSAKKIAHKMHEHCRYNFASVKGSGRCIKMPGEPRKGACKKGTIDPNELFPLDVASKCSNNVKECEKFVEDNKGATKPETIKKYAQHKFFLTIKECSDDFMLPVVALHNNDMKDTKGYLQELESKRPKPGAADAKSIEKGKHLEETMDKLKVTIDKTPGAKKKPGDGDLAELKKTMKEEFKATDTKKLFEQKGKTNIFRWCESDELAKCHVGDPEHPDDVVWTTNEADFAILSTKDINVVLQADPSTKASKKAKSGESDTDLSTLFMNLARVFAEQTAALAASLEQRFHEDLKEVTRMVREFEQLAKYDDLRLGEGIKRVLEILLGIVKILVDILTILGVVVGGAIRIGALRYINIETAGKKMDPKKDPGKFDFITDVLDPLGLNCCDASDEQKVKSELGQ